VSTSKCRFLPLTGATTEPGVWFVGLPWLTRRGSGLFLGLPSDAAKIAGPVARHLAKC
jgi:hypothetical protein